MAPPAPATPDLAALAAKYEGNKEEEQRAMHESLTRFRERQSEERRLDRDADDRRQDIIEFVTRKQVEEKLVLAEMDRKDSLRDELRRIQIGFEDARMRLSERASMMRDLERMQLVQWLTVIRARINNYMMQVEQIVERQRKLENSISLINHMRDLDENRSLTLDLPTMSRLFNGDEQVLKALGIKKGESLGTVELPKFFDGGQRLSSLASTSMTSAANIADLSKDITQPGGRIPRDPAAIKASLDKIEADLSTADQEIKEKWKEIRRDFDTKAGAYANAARRSINAEHDGLFDRVLVGGDYNAEDLTKVLSEVGKFKQSFEIVRGMQAGFDLLVADLPAGKVQLSPATRQVLEKMADASTLNVTKAELDAAAKEMQTKSRMAAMMANQMDAKADKKEDVAVRKGSVGEKPSLVSGPVEGHDEELKRSIPKLKSRSAPEAAPRMG